MRAIHSTATGALDCFPVMSGGLELLGPSPTHRPEAYPFVLVSLSKLELIFLYFTNPVDAGNKFDEHEGTGEEKYSRK